MNSGPSPQPDVFPSNVLYSRFNSQPLEMLLFPCNSGSIESLEHMLLYCAMHNDICSSNLELILVSLTGPLEEAILHNPLVSMNKTYTRQTAKFISLLIQQLELNF